MFDNCEFKWNYKPTKTCENGYEKMVRHLKFDKKSYQAMSDLEKDAFDKRLLAHIREINVFPVNYYNEKGIHDEIKEFLYTNVNFDEGVSSQMRAGFSLLDYLFPNMHLARVFNNKTCVYDRFYDDTCMLKIIRYFLSRYSFKSMRTLYMMSTRFLWSTPSNFLPLRAKAIYEKFVKPGGTVFDYSCGYGGRMLGCLGSRNNYKYIGCEPNHDTYENLIQLGSLIEEVTRRKDSYKIFNCGSECLQYHDVDFAFSCPPYYKLEYYSEEETQSIIKYPVYKDWLEYYVRPTVKNSYNMLKTDGKYGVVVSNYMTGPVVKPVKDDWLKIAKQEGFKNIAAYNLYSKNRSGNEQLYIFEK